MHQHSLTRSPYEDYLICEDCASLFRKEPVDLPAIYEGKRYWEESTGHPRIVDQVFNCNVHQENGLSKNDFVLARLPKGMDAVAEIACAPGILLNRLVTEGYAFDVIGFEVDPSYDAAIRAIAGVPIDIRYGYFPASSRYLHDGELDAIIALDVLEHVPDAEKFLKECARLLNNNGKLILMLPLVDSLGQVYHENALHPEHIALYSRMAILELMADTGFKDVTFGEWHSMHQSIEAVKA